MATLQTRLQDLATAIGTQIKTIKTTEGQLTALTTDAKTSLVAAINELQAEINAAVAASGATINDAATVSTTQTYSITKIRDLVSTSIAVLTTGAPAAMDTLDELSAALGDDANFAATITTALANRVRFDAVQTLTAPQKAQAKANIDAYGSLELGNPDTDLVAVLTTAMA
jgi:hypothetical protein